jgi:hypothetical protein
MKLLKVVIIAVGIVSFTNAFASSPYEGLDSVESGEAGYTIGCSAAAAMGVAACGELPSGGSVVQSGAYEFFHPQTDAISSGDRGIPTGEEVITPDPSPTPSPTPAPTPYDDDDSAADGG